MGAEGAPLPLSTEDYASLLGLKMVVADATDVAFQRNPFRTDRRGGCFGPPRAAVGVVAVSNISSSSRTEASALPLLLPLPLVIGTQENGRMTFKKEKYNRRWMQCIDGGAALGRLARAYKPVVCAGVTLGNGAGMLAYFTAQLLQIARPSLVRCSLSVIGAALDQATHNYILHTAEGISSPSAGDGGSVLGASPFSQLLLGGGAAGGVDAGEGSNAAEGLRGRLVVFPSPPSGDAPPLGSAEHPARGAAEVAADPSASAAVATAAHHQMPLAVLLAHHEQDHCTFHGNFGQLKTIEMSRAQHDAFLFADEEGRRGGDGGGKSGDDEISIAGPAGGGDGATEGRVLLAVNPSGAVYDIVHQYSSDRHPPLMKELARRYLGRRR